MRCDGCRNWTTARVTRYADGSEVFNWRAPAGKGRCSVLEIDTPEVFGCTQFAELLTNGQAPTAFAPHVVTSWKNGAPWQHSVAGPCPDCKGNPGVGAGPRCQCAGTGKVRYYDDGFIGEEQTRLHPKEREKVEPPRCRSCREVVDVKWKACPLCGTRLEPVAETETVGGFGNAGGEFRKNDDRAATLGNDIEAMNERDARVATLRRMTVEGGCTEAEVAMASSMADRLEAMR